MPTHVLPGVGSRGARIAARVGLRASKSRIYAPLERRRARELRLTIETAPPRRKRRIVPKYPPPGVSVTCMRGERRSAQTWTGRLGTSKCGSGRSVPVHGGSEPCHRDPAPIRPLPHAQHVNQVIPGAACRLMHVLHAQHVNLRDLAQFCRVMQVASPAAGRFARSGVVLFQPPLGAKTRRARCWPPRPARRAGDWRTP